MTQIASEGQKSPIKATAQELKADLAKYVHPYFWHDEDGDIQGLNHPTLDPFDPFAVPIYPEKSIILEKPLTEEIINTHFIKVTDSLIPTVSLPQLLNFQYNNYYNSLIGGDESVQPFFNYLKQLLTSRIKDFRKRSYDEIWHWIHSHEEFKDDKSTATTATALPTLPVGFPNKMWEAAIWYTYQGIRLDKSNAKHLVILNELASKMGFNSQSSGSKLGGRFLDVEAAAKRTDTEGRQIKDRMKRIQKVINFLPDEYKPLAEADIETLNKKL